MGVWERYLYAHVHAERPLLVRRLVPLLLAFDTWLLMIGHAGRYGAGGFNVSHFALLDGVLPLPSPGEYIALLILSGACALVAALQDGTARRLFGLCCVLYTASWAISMLDSYQHHYFLSLVLFCLAFFPDRARPAGDQPGGGRQRRDGGYTTLCATVGIVYAYAALAKCEPTWVSGHTLAQLTSLSLNANDLSPAVENGLVTAAHWLASLAHACGIGPSPSPSSSPTQALLSIMATVTIPVEFALSLAYVLAPLRDELQGNRGRRLRGVVNVGLLLALSLHLGAEAISLSIGWFSYYMLLLAVCCLSPTVVVRAAAAPMLCLEKLLQTPLRTFRQEVAGDGERGAPFGLAVIAGGLHLFVGVSLDLPGALPAAVMLAGSGLLWTALLATRRQLSRSVGGNLALITAGLLLWMGITGSDVRFDYYKFLGGDLYRRGELRASLHAYEQAQRYAPPGQSRKKKIEQLRQRLGITNPKR